MSESSLKVHNGKLIRPGIWRGPEPAALEYAKHAATITSKIEGCFFCHAHELPAFQKAIGSGAVIASLPPYAHFAGRIVRPNVPGEFASHQLYIPGNHIEHPSQMDDEQITELMGHYRQEEARVATYGDSLQLYVRTDNSVSKSVPHLHFHLEDLMPDQVTTFDYTLDAGVTTLKSARTEDNLQPVMLGATQIDADPTVAPISDYFTIRQSPIQWGWFDGQKVVAHEVIESVNPRQAFADLPPHAIRDYWRYIDTRSHTGRIGEFAQDVPQSSLTALGYRAELLTLEDTTVASLHIVPNEPVEIEFEYLTPDQRATLWGESKAA